MTEFSPSDLRHRLTLEQLSRVADEGGGFTESWVTVATLSADLARLGATNATRLTGSPAATPIR